MSQNKRAIANSFSRAASSYDSAAHVQRQVGEALLQVLSVAPNKVNSALDIGCGTGALTIALADYAQHITALDLAPGMLDVARTNDRHNVINEFVCGDAEKLPFTGQQFDLVFSSFALQWCENLQSVFEDVYSLLKPGGRFVFSLPVENTLRELKLSWAQAEKRYHHVNDFHTIAEVKAALAATPFAVLQLHEKLDQVYYQSVRDLARELKALGVHQVTSQRNQALTGKTTVFQMMNAYEHFRNPQGMLPASWHYIIVCLEKQ